MNQDELTTLLNDLIATWENEVIEFKRGKKEFSQSEIGQYFSALANEANLRHADFAWLVFGVDDRTRKVVGTDYKTRWVTAFMICTKPKPSVICPCPIMI